MMNFFRKLMPSATLTAILLLLACLAEALESHGPKLSESKPPYTKGVNKHNLSAANVGVTYRALAVADGGETRGTQICIFCHTPHSANVEGQAPLWNRAFSSETFQRYTSGSLKIRGIANAQYGDGAQPNGSSKLCLSCHDGASILGDLFTGADIPLADGKTVIEGLASFKSDTNKMKAGHHPVSFVYMTNFNSKATPQTGTIHSELTANSAYRFLPASSAGKVKLFDTNRNGNGWMQCTTCHDPHQNQAKEVDCYNGSGGLVECDPTNTRKVAPFWVYHGATDPTATEDTESVCRVCHAMAPAVPPATYAPWPTTATYP